MNATAEIRVFPHSQFEQLELRFDADYGIMWHFMKPSARPVFNPQLLAELRAFHGSIEQRNGLVWDDGEERQINYLVLGSKTPGVYNLGGDLNLFREAITAQDRERLVEYGRKCIDNMY